MANVLNQNLAVIGQNLDNTEDNASNLLLDLFPDTLLSDNVLKRFETTFGLSGSGDFTARKSAVIAAHRARGGLSKTYYEDLGNEMGNKQVTPYTVVLNPGSSPLGCRISTYSALSTPQGPASIWPAQMYNSSGGDSAYTIMVIVTGSAGPENELEKSFNKKVPAHCNFIYSYVP